MSPSPEPHRAPLEWGALYLRGPRKSLIFGVSYCSLAGDNISVLPLGAPKELRSNGERGIGSRPNCSVAAGHFAFPADNIGAPRELRSNGESGGLGRPLIKWSGNQPCDLPDARASPTLCPQPFSRRDLKIALRIWILLPPVCPSLLRRYFFGIACPRRWFHKRLRAFQLALKGCSISAYARSK